VVVHDLDFEGVATTPLEADSVLVVDPNAMLSPTISLERFEAIRGRDSQVLKSLGSIQHP